MHCGVRGPWRLSLLTLLLCGCAADQMSPSTKAMIATAVAPLGISVHETPGQPDGFRMVKPEDLPPPIQPLIAAPGTAPLNTRNAASLQRLYQKQNVNGRELIDELVAVRKAMKEKRSAMAVTQFMGSMEAGKSQLAAGRLAPNLGRLVGDSALKMVEALVAQQSQAIGYQALDDYLGFLIEDPKLLGSERISLPSAQGLNPRQLQRGATMAALVVAARVTANVLKQAKADFASLETEYGALIQRREEAARLLYQALSGPGAGTGFSGGDLDYLRDNLQRMSLQEFANDLGTQNLALEHLRRSNPSSFQSYQAQADGLTARTKGLLRTSSGALAFGAMLVNFSQSVVAVAKDKQAGEILGLMPMAFEFASAAPPIVRHVIEAGSQGAEVMLSSSKRFRLVDANGKVDEYGDAEDVFKQLGRRGDARQLFDESLFRNGAPGLIYRLYQCDRLEAGRLIDTAVPSAERERFASAYLSAPDPRFSFANTFETPRTGNTREQELGDELLRRDHRRSTDEGTRSFSALQQATTKGYASWGDEQLLRLVFANREGQAAHATLQLGDVRLRPVPNMQSIYVYESLVDGCRGQAAGARRLTPEARKAPPAVRKPQVPAQTQPRSVPTPPKAPAAAKKGTP